MRRFVQAYETLLHEHDRPVDEDQAFGGVEQPNDFRQRTFDSVAGTSSAQVTVGSFDTTTDFVFYSNENQTTTSAILATSQATTVGGLASSVITLPDGTAMTLVGVTQAQLTPGLFKP